MNDDLQSYIDPELEARIVALVLGEASAFESGGLEKMIEEQPELAAFKARMEAVHGVVKEAHAEGDDGEWKLSDEKRNVILSRCRESAEAEFLEERREQGSRRSQRHLIYACAACLLLTLIFGGMLMPMGTKASYSVETKGSLSEEVSREDTLARLDKELMEQSELVQGHRKDLNTVVQQYGLPYFDENAPNSLGATEQDMFRGARQRLANFQTQRDETEAQLEELESLLDEDRVTYASGLALPENQVHLYIGKHREALDERRALVEKGFGSRHPDIIAVEERAEGAMKSARKEAESLKEVSRTKLELLNRQVDRMSEMIDSRKGDTVDLSLQQHTYTQAKETFEQSRAMLREMKIKQNEERSRLGFPLIGEPEEARGASASLAKLDGLMPATKGKPEQLRRFSREAFPAAKQEATDEASPASPTELDALADRLSLANEAKDPVLGYAKKMKDAEVKVPSLRKPAAPSASMSTAVAAATVDPSAVPVPEVEVPSVALNFGDDVSFGEGWGWENRGFDSRNQAVGEDRQEVAELSLGQRIEVPSSFFWESGTERESRNVELNLPQRKLLNDGFVPEPKASPKREAVEKELAKKETLLKKQARENFETATAVKSDSTFSLNVSDVSFKLAKAALTEGNWPDAAKVRPEEFVNALDYDDTKPSQAEKVASVIEQGAHPFLPQRNLMRIAMSTASLGRNASTPLRLTILLDQSGSMERADRAESVKRAFALLAAQLTKNDEVTLIGFARAPRLLAERMRGDKALELAKIVAHPLTEGGTNLEAALSSGLQLAQQQFLAEAQNRIILLTDGAANLGDALPVNLAKQVESMRKLGIAFDACGVGADGLNDEVLSSLAKQGDGRYYFLDRPEDADAGFAKQIAGALRPAAKNVKVQILFNPERVSSFKLYGFEKHRLKKEDFRNDRVDAAEMAAEESGVALYHFEPLPQGRGDVGTVSVRFFDPASDSMVERTWAIPYEPEVALFSEAKAGLRLASVAGLFAEKLKGGVVGERVELKRLRQEIEKLKPNFDQQSRYHELSKMLQQAGN